MGTRWNTFALSDILLAASVAATVAASGLVAWGWSRQRNRFLVGALATFLGFTAWNLVLSATNADQKLNVDWPVIPLSWADVGSGVMAFVATALGLGLATDRGAPAWRVVLAAGIAALLAIFVDLAVL